MAIRKAETTWLGTLREGNGRMSVGSGGIDVPYSFGTRFGDEKGTNPEELIGAAHAGCFSMFLSAQVTNAGFSPERIHTVADVHFGRDETGPVIEKIVLTTNATIPGIDNEKFQELVKVSKQNCPVSRALASVPDVVVNASLAE
jgi:osmotically inducible protein OsmC